MLQILDSNAQLGRGLGVAYYARRLQGVAALRLERFVGTGVLVAIVHWLDRRQYFASCASFQVLEVEL